MRVLLRSVAMSFTMFSIFPMPKVEWREENMRYMLCALPLVGAAVGAGLWLWDLLCGWLEMGGFLWAVGLTLIPLALSGGIHMDGFCDTVDALSSHAGPDRKREILKDPRTGAFGAMAAAADLLLYAGLCAELSPGSGTALALTLHQVMARALGGLAGTAFPMSGGKGLLASFRAGAAGKAPWILGGWAALAGAGMIWLSPVSGGLCALAAAGCLLYVYRMARREFGGMSGDLAGYLITVSQPVLLACYILGERVVRLWF